MHEVIIDSSGRIRTVYSDALAPTLAKLGAVSIARASMVEPGAGGWLADLAAVRGPVLGPFALRAEALAAEVKWLLDNGTPIPAGGK